MCTIQPNGDYVGRQAGIFLMSCLPLVGPSLTPLVPSVTNKQSDLDNVNNNLKSRVEDWQSKITDITAANTQDIKNMLDLFSQKGGYVETIAALTNEPTRERSIINTVNIVFISIIISIIIISIKK